ncbi:MAG: hypothetical protein Q9218_007079 [Villophora microphyllina]
MPTLSSGLPGLALPPMKTNDFIEYVLQYHEAPTTVVVCSSRDTFVENLRSLLYVADEQPESPMTGESHPLLVPTIHQLATSRTIKLAFAPTLPHLRAYLASYAPEEGPDHVPAALAKPHSGFSMLAVYGFLSLHRSTTEYALQGLSRSLAIAVEAAETWGMQLVLIEDPNDWDLELPEQADEAETRPARDIWKEQVPLLNSSIALSDDRAWAGRIVNTGAVVSKWCFIIQ